MSGKELRLLIVAECGDSVALAEAEALRPVVGRLDCVTVPAGAEGLLGRLGNRLKVRKAVRKIMGQRSLEYDAVVTYGTSVAGEVGVGLSGATGVRHIAREELYTSIGCAVVQMSAVAGHRTEDHALTFVSADNGLSTLEMMVGMAVARPGSRIEWRVAGDAPVMQEGGLRIPENLVVESCGSIEEAFGRGAVDWMVDFSGSQRPPFVDLCRALSAGVPVVVVESAGVEDVFDDECCVILGGSPTKEEFIRGMLPYIDSDIRSGRLREGAKACWSSDHNPEAVAARLVEVVLKRIEK